MYKSYSMELAGRTLTVDINRVAKQANGAALMHYGDTTVLSTATASKEPREGIDFFPLSVEYEEKMYAVGKIPGGFNKREGKASEHAILTSRVIDRPMRPLFPKDYRNDVTLVNMVMSVDPECNPEIPAMLGSAIATCISDIPFDGPCATTQVGLINGEYIINPTMAQKDVSDLQLTVASTREKVIMIEAGAKEVPEDKMIEAIYKAQTMYPDVHFVLVDATPTLDDDTVIADNTCSIFFAEEQSGFLAGYAAVKEGYRKLGFFGALAVPAVVRFGYGFVDGAEYAAKELGLEAGSIEMKYTYTGAFGNSPDFQAKAAAWYQSGTECIFGCGGPDNVFAACEATGGDCVSIGVDTDMSQITETCLTSAMKMLTPAVYGAIKAYYNDTFPGGTSETLTINEDAVGLPMESSRFKNFTQADYDAIVEVLKADKDGVTSSIRRDVDADGNTVAIEDVAATLQYVTVQVVE